MRTSEEIAVVSAVRRTCWVRLKPDTTSWAVWLAAGLVTLMPASGRGAEPTASEFARSLQRKYDAVKDFSADFVHVYEGGVLRKQITERGHVLIKKPG